MIMKKLLGFPLSASSKTQFRTNIRTTDHKDNAAIAVCLLNDDLKWTGFLLEQNTHGFDVSEKGL